MTSKFLALTAGLIAASYAAAFAHEGVKNPAVMERMHGMKAIAAQMKTLGGMAKGETTFEADKAQTAATAIAGHAEDVAELFQAEEMDPKSEAKPEIWANWPDFVEKSEDFEQAALKATQIDSMDDLRGAMKALGDSCKSCHELYRVEN